MSAFAIAWGKFFALATVSAAILAFPCATLLVSSEFSNRSCSHVYRPLLESPKEEALKMYDAYMADPETSPMVKKAHKSIVLRILEQRAKDHYQTVQTNETASWTFPGFYDWSNGSPFVEPSARFATPALNFAAFPAWFASPGSMPQSVTETTPSGLFADHFRSSLSVSLVLSNDQCDAYAFVLVMESVPA